MDHGDQSGVEPGNLAAAVLCGLPEQVAASFGPDVLTLEMRPDESGNPGPSLESGGSAVSLLESPPQVRLTAETEMEYYRRKQSHIAVRHASGDSLVAVVEVVSPGNKASRTGLRSFVEKAAEFLERQIHLLILDVLPPLLAIPRVFMARLGRDHRRGL